MQEYKSAVFQIVFKGLGRIFSVLGEIILPQPEILVLNKKAAFPTVGKAAFSKGVMARFS